MRVQPDAVFVPLNIAVLTVSDTRTYDNDTSGELLASRSVEIGHRLVARALLKDDLYKIRAQVATWIADEQVQVVLITGGTGFTGRDSTPEAVECLLDKRIDGFGELFRALSILDIGTSTVQSRALAGLSNRTRGEPRPTMPTRLRSSCASSTAASSRASRSVPPSARRTAPSQNAPRRSDSRGC